MRDETDRAGDLFHAVARQLAAEAPRASSAYRLPLTVNMFGEDEIAAALEVLARGPLTLGPRVADFERAFAREQGAFDAVFCNSGSSANLLSVAALGIPDAPGGPVLRPGDEVVVPAVTWPTTIWPVAQLGAVPVLADVSPRTLNLTTASVAAALSPKTRAVFAVHLLGNPAPIQELDRLCRERGLVLLEDACEALDAESGGRKVGTVGRFGTYSFYFSHHISTIEGGMVACRSRTDADRLRALRAHGWVRQMSPEARGEAEAAHPDIDPRFLFPEMGFNLRPTELQAAIGLVQLRRRGAFLRVRREAAAAWRDALAKRPDLYEVVESEEGASPFALPIVLRRDGRLSRGAMAARLEGMGIETRPLVAGNVAMQPGLQRCAHRIGGALPGAQALHERALYIGIHPALTRGDIAWVAHALVRADEPEGRTCAER